ncbi:DegT/DnrJ/EryC1/StrS family aminotransferase [candidate division KSB1 bacterium]|nr:MAG: DegT/DnrJ/EryC1/StrS family aminotransferase [candidate division KSB1 bacterium]MBC6946585.1 DegT/DnrJ/EryC1/StrS family aminotransferase [candidate division KSB1 bacterium]MCE7940180.1 DegT/DnrJ/EryC1/StrS family aminotransferase [Chlorobi bacterium CHB1]MDL1873849.1 DegT/DnrJ/EryC1/StrS family aminotransferase [Cytophagia bacterium CHB2]
MKIPQVLPWLDQDEISAVNDTIKANWITEGRLSTEFSLKLNELIGTQYGVFAPNGTLALFLGLLAMGIGPGDEVIVPDCTFIASANAVILTGAKPVFVDVNRLNYQIDVSQCEHLVTPRTRAIMPVHLFGMTANMMEVMQFAERYHLRVIEDAAQAIGVRYKGRHAGTFGDIGCFSFFADKTITTGEGGYVVCKDKGLYERLLLLRNQGRIDRGSFIHPAIGYNFRMTDLQAAIGLVQLAKLDTIIQRKHIILEWYHRELDSIENIQFVTVVPESEYVPFRVVLICRGAHSLMTYLSEHGVQSRTFFFPLHRQPCFEYLGRAQGGMLDLDDELYPNAVFGYENGICLPVFPTLSNEQVDYICSHIKEFYVR